MQKLNWKIIFALASFIIPFVVYLKTLSPSVNFGDTGELITAAYTLGIPHPPGFSIWCLLAKIFTLLPIKSVAWRVNLSSAVFSAATITVVFLISKSFLTMTNPKETKGRKNKTLIPLTALVVSLIFAFTKEFWLEAVYAEVYPLNTLLSALIIFWTLLWFKKRKNKYLYLLSFTYGISLTNHYLILLLAPPLTLWFILFERSIIKKPKRLIFMTISFLLGISFFLYLPIRSRSDPPIDWGNPETIESVLVHIGREQFALSDKFSLRILNLPIIFFPSWIGFVSRGLSTFSKSLFVVLKTFSPLLVIIGFSGGVFLLIKSRKSFFLLLFLFLSTSWGYAFATYDKISSISPKKHSFLPYTPSFLFFVPFLALGFFLFLKYISSRCPKRFYSLPFLIFLVLPLIPFFKNFEANDWSQDFIAQNHADNILKTVDQGALIFAEENNWIFPLLYMKIVEGKRPDVTIYDRSGNLFDDVYREARKKYISEEDFENRRRKIEERLIKETNRPAYYAIDKNFENYRYENIAMEGILYKQKKGEVKKIDFAKEYQNILGIEGRRFKDAFRNDYIIAYYHLRFGDSLCQDGRLKKALEEYEKAFQWGKDERRILNNLAVIHANLGKEEKAEEIIKRVLTINPKNAIAHHNLGTIYKKMGETEKAKEEYKKALELNSKHLSTIINLSSLYESEGDYKKALEGYQTALSLKPSDEEIKKRINALSQKMNETEKLSE